MLRARGAAGWALIVLVWTAPLVAADGWHLAGWSGRAIVTIAKPLSVAGVDTAAVRIVHQGRARPDGADFRVLDAVGKPVPFQLSWHDPDGYSLLAFRAVKPVAGARFFVYFGNSQAARAGEQVVASAKPGAGPPKGSWIPHQGLVFATIQRPEGENPKTVADLAQLMAASKERYGARYQQRVADGHNPFGPSDYYISSYRGWIRIPRDGTYHFCTASNEASFSFLDGKPLVHWPGRHTSERGARGEKNQKIELKAGLHYLEYYHEEVMLKQVAFLGWSPPGSQKGHFAAIPEALYPLPHPATVTGYEKTDGPLPAFVPAYLDTIWPDPGVRAAGQYTRVRLAVESVGSFPKGTTFRWEFGDGQVAAGASVDHVYLAMGRYQAKLTATSGKHRQSVTWPLEVFEVQHVAGDISQGRHPDYVKLTAGYELKALDAKNLKELVHLYGESGQAQQAVTVGRAWVARFAASQPEQAPAVRRVLALAVLSAGEKGIEEAIANFQASITAKTPTVEALDSLAQLIRLVGIRRDKPDQTPALLKQVNDVAVNAKPPLQQDATAKMAYRRAINAAGDVLLWHGKTAEARGFYKRVEVLAGKPIPRSVRAARIGSYPNSIREYLVARNYGAALGTVERWEDQFATEKVKGHTFYWRGVTLALRGQHREASEYLDLAVTIAVGAEWENEARWRLALAFEAIGKPRRVRIELAKLVATGISDRWTDRARKKLKALPAKKPAAGSKPKTP
ncbi:MAG: PKD domain-containing protein [Planctomycetaceae bacterium]|jgi:hypothetical protein|nr:PKD domain-containing protein [Planctomycetaceae bacterium]